LGHNLFPGQVYRGIVYDWVLGLGGVPDEPHAVNVSEKTEGNGVGVLKEPPVSANGLPENVNTLAKAQTASSLCFRITLTDCLEVSWETLLLGRKLIVEIPNGILPEGSKERYCDLSYLLVVLLLILTTVISI